MSELMMQNVQEQLNLPTSFEQTITPEVAQKIENLKSTVDIHDKRKVIAYGREQQSAIGKFYDSILQGIGTQEVGEAGDLLVKVIADINGYDDDCSGRSKGIFSFFQKKKNTIEALQIRYKSLSQNIDYLVKQLQEKYLALRNISRNFDIMFAENYKLYDFLTLIIYAGEQVLTEEKYKLSLLQEKANSSGNLVEMQKVSDFEEDITRFERRLYDLKLTRTISLQQAPQIRLIQKGADEISESIQTTIANSIPLWKSQMAMALGIKTVRESLNAVNSVRNATNAMLVSNSENTKKLALETAKAVETGVVDVETITQVNQNLLDALNGSYEITQNAITTRESGTKQLQENEAELKSAIINLQF